MKIKGLLLGMLACAALGACTNNDLVEGAGSENVTGNSYIAISILSPNATGPRATDGDFEAGRSNENAVNSAVFLFFNEAGALVQAVDGNPAELAKPDGTWTDGTGSSEKISNAVIVLENPTSEPRKVIALLNSTLTATAINTNKNNYSLSGVKGLINDYSSTENFVMSNSVYYGNCEVELKDENIQSSEQLAKSNPVNIYVERVLAKVSVTESNVTINTTEVILDGNSVQLKPEIVGYKLVATNPVSYLMKNIEGCNFSWGWDDPTNHRSYWAVSATPEKGYTYYNYDEVSNKAPHTEYCLENTNSNTHTTLLVAAKIKATTNTDAPVSILKYKGMYYTEDGFKTYAANALKDYKFGETSSNDWKQYIKIVKSNSAGAKAWDVKAELTDDAPKVEGAAEKLAELGTAMEWKDGRSYFYVPVEHLGHEPQNIGVVRNHVYKLNIESISGLGTPVYDPNEEIIPEKPAEEEYYVAAKIEILKWKVVNQSVDLK